MKNTKDVFYRAYIAANKHSRFFDCASSEKSRAAAVAAVKRRNSPDWRDCLIWSVCYMPCGIEYHSL